MIYLISSLFYILSFSILADEHISLSLLNSELKKNYAFTERSLNQSDLKIESSSGNIFLAPEHRTPISVFLDTLINEENLNTSLDV